MSTHIYQSFFLFFSVIIGGGLGLYLGPKPNNKFHDSLVFVGGFLLTITIIHILPELYHDYSLSIGLYIIIGFFIQLFLEYFTGGVEHGHINYEKTSDSNDKKSIDHNLAKTLVLFLPLYIHSLLDSIMLLDVGINHHHHSHISFLDNIFELSKYIDIKKQSVLLGIVLHKMPAAFALSTLIYTVSKNKYKTSIFIVLFALASPMGLIIGNYFIDNISSSFLSMLKAIAGGSFLSISTTIFFESNPDHTLSFKKLISASLGALLAIILELI